MDVLRTGFIVLLLALGGCGQRDSSVPSSPASPESKSEEKSEDESRSRSVFSLAEVKTAKMVRQKETKKYGNLTQDAVIPVDACFVQEELRIPTTIGVVHLPYDSPDTFTLVARKSAESALSGTPLEPGCSRREAGYWVRDAEGKGDFVFRISAEAGTDAELWWVPDSGEPRRTRADDIRPRVYIDRLLNVAGTRADADGDLQGALELVLDAQALGPSSKRVAEVKTELVCLVHPPTAVKDLNEFTESFGSSDALDATLADCLLEIKTADSLEQAKELIDAVLLRNPGQLKALSLRAEHLADEGRFVEANQTYESVLTHHPAAYMAHYGAATALLGLGRNRDALKHLNRYLKVDPQDVDALFLRAGARVDVGNVEGATSDLAVLKSKVPEAPELVELEKRIKAASPQP